MAPITRERPYKPRTFRPRPGDRISFCGAVFIVPKKVNKVFTMRRVDWEEMEDAEDIAVATERLENPAGTISLDEIIKRDAEVAC